MSRLGLTRDKIYKTVARQLHGVVPCWVCGQHVLPAAATLEHIVPLCEGATRTWPTWPSATKSVTASATPKARCRWRALRLGRWGGAADRTELAAKSVPQAPSSDKSTCGASKICWIMASMASARGLARPPCKQLAKNLVCKSASLSGWSAPPLK